MTHGLLTRVFDLVTEITRRQPTFSLNVKVVRITTRWVYNLLQTM